MKILNTKIRIPILRSMLVQRPELLESLNKGMLAKLTMVTAPAGYGKTTLLSEWANQCDVQIAWLSLDKQENDLNLFWGYIIAAIEHACVDHSASLQPILSYDLSENFESSITALLNELTYIHGKTVLVLDDFHVIELRSIHDSVAFFLEHLPAHFHIIIASRTKLTLPTARLQARGDLCQLMIEDMRFQLNEGIQYLKHCMELSLSEEEASLLVQKTEGWISGLHMAGLSLKKSKDISGFIQRFSGQHRDIAIYFLEEVFGKQSEATRTFLLKTSILSRMNCLVCEAVTSHHDCQDQLEMLERLQLFVIPLDEERGWYRYHYLFSDFLKRQLRQRHAEWWSQSHAHAARWFEANGFVEEAVDRYLAGNHISDALRIFEKRQPVLMQINCGVLYRWLSVLPVESITDKPDLEIFYIGVLIGVGEWNLAKLRLLVIQEKLMTDQWKPFIEKVYLISATIAIFQKNLELTSAFFEKFDMHMPEGSYFQMMGADTESSADSDHFLSYINDLHEADTFFRRWIKAWESKVNYPFVGYFYVSNSDLMYEWNRLEEAEEYAVRVHERQDMLPFARIIVRAAINLSQVQYAKGQFNRAFEELEQAKLKINSPSRLVFIAKIDSQIAYLSLLQGRNTAVASWLQSCGLKHTDEIPVFRIPEYLILAKALEQTGQTGQASILLERLFILVSKGNRQRDMIKVLIVQCMGLERQGNTEAAIDKLSKALRLAEPQGYIRSFVDEGKSMAELLTCYLRMRQNRFVREPYPVSLSYIKSLLQILNIPVEGHPLYTVLLTDQEIKIIRFIEKGLSNKQIAEQISITLETVKSHIKNMYRKLQVNSRLQALRRGKEIDLL